MDNQEDDWRTRRLHEVLDTLRQDDVDGTFKALRSLRIIVWFERLLTLSGEKTAYAVGKLIQPEVYGKTKNGTIYRHNLWPKYARGKHLPHKALIERAEQKFPGSSTILDHVIFEALDLSRPISQSTSRLLQRLRFEVQAAVYEEAMLKLDLFVRKNFSFEMIDEISSCAHIDAVAAFVILYREACEVETIAPIFSLGEGLYRNLLVVAVMSLNAPFGKELAAVVGQYVFALGSRGGCRVRLDIKLFQKQCNALELLIDYLYRRKRVSPTAEGYCEAGHDILLGMLGQSISHLFLPSAEYSLPIECVTKEARVCVETTNNLRTWAWQTTMSGRHSNVVPDSIIDELLKLGNA